MSTKVLLDVPDDLYQQVEKVAITTQRNIPDLLLETITRTFAPFPLDPNRGAMRKNIAAYRAQHAQLVKSYLGQYVAICNGKLIDHDPDPVILLQRVRSRYPDRIVLRRKVEAVAERELRIRNPKIEAIA